MYSKHDIQRSWGSSTAVEDAEKGIMFFLRHVMSSRLSRIPGWASIQTDAEELTQNTSTQVVGENIESRNSSLIASTGKQPKDVGEWAGVLQEVISGQGWFGALNTPWKEYARSILSIPLPPPVSDKHTAPEPLVEVEPAASEAEDDEGSKPTEAMVRELQELLREKEITIQNLVKEVRCFCQSKTDRSKGSTWTGISSPSTCE